jgi:hypothetical protein
VAGWGVRSSVWYLALGIVLARERLVDERAEEFGGDGRLPEWIGDQGW